MSGFNVQIRKQEDLKYDRLLAIKYLLSHGRYFLFLSKKVLPASEGTMMKYLLPNAMDISHNFHLPMENWGQARSVFDVAQHMKGRAHPSLQSLATDIVFIYAIYTYRYPSKMLNLHLKTSTPALIIKRIKSTWVSSQQIVTWTCSQMNSA